MSNEANEAQLSPAMRLARLSPEEQAAILGDLSEEELAELEWSWDNFWARPDQVINDEPYFPIHLLLTGRGWGKSRTMSEWVRKQAMNHPGCRIGILGRSAKDVRDVMILGESGILNVGPPAERPVHRPSESRLIWPNGSQVQYYSAEAPDAVRGVQFHYFGADELASHSPFVGVDGLTAMQNLRIATRLGEKPYGVVATTPKRVQVLRDLLAEAQEGRVRVVRGRTTDNLALSSDYIETVVGTFKGTSVELQELEGVLLDEDTEGVLWSRDSIDPHRHLSPAPPRLPLRVVAVDPSVAENPRDECGIVVVGSTDHRALTQRHAYILEDASLKASPEVWAQRVVDMCEKWNTSYVVVELNQGQHLVKMAIHAIKPSLKIFGINAMHGKFARAEPVVLPYQQGRVHHFGYWPELEDQMTMWSPEGAKSSPDRLDAMVHGVTALLLSPPKGLGGGALRARSMSGRQLPSGQGTGRSRMTGTLGKSRR